MNNHIDCSKVYIDKAGHKGLGVFAKQNLQEGEVVEIGIVWPLKNVDGNENPHLFTWSDDKSVWAAGSGCLPIYNHSFNPNCKKNSDLLNNKLYIIALHNIERGTELLTTYNSAKWRKCFKDLS